MWLNVTQLPNNDWIYDKEKKKKKKSVMMTEQETGVGDSERPFFLAQARRSHRMVAFSLTFLKHISQGWWRKKKKKKKEEEVETDAIL